MSDYEPAGLEAREAADGLAYEEWRNRMRADDDEHDDDGERVVAIREDGTARTEPDEEPNDWRERTR